MPKIFRRETARRDPDRTPGLSWENAGLHIPERFLAHAESRFNDLGRQPLIGAPLMLKHPDLAGMRKWRVKDFDKPIIFYLPRDDGVSIVHMLHAPQDWWKLLDIED